jgi:hypothetical protein
MRPDPFDRVAGTQKLKQQVSGPEDMFDEFPHRNFEFAFQSISNAILKNINLKRSI